MQQVVRNMTETVTNHVNEFLSLVIKVYFCSMGRHSN